MINKLINFVERETKLTLIYIHFPIRLYGVVLN
jgi:hypothetical protein